MSRLHRAGAIAAEELVDFYWMTVAALVELGRLFVRLYREDRHSRVIMQATVACWVLAAVLLVAGA